MFNFEVKFLTCDESLHLKNGDFKSYKYETKKKAEESVYDVGKRSFCERRGGHWRAPRPRQIRQFESKLRDRTIVFCDWSTDSIITVVFSSGAIAYLTVKPETLDVTQILFDRYCVGKLSGQTVTGVIMCKSHLLFTHVDRMATLVTFGKITNTNTPSRIRDRDPHVQSIEIGGGARRVERKASWCELGAGLRVLVWGAAAAEPAPWSPALQDLANLHLYHIQGQQITLVAYHQLENETLSAELSSQCDNMIHIVEQLARNKTGVSLNWARYEVPAGEERVCKLSSVPVSTTRAPLPAPARVARRSPCGARLLAACIDGSLHVMHHVAGLTHSTKAGFIATDVRWAGELVLAAEEAGRLQCFDRALSLLNHHTKCIDLTPYLRDARRMQVLADRSFNGGPLVLASFAGGPLALLRISHPRLLTAWIRSGRTGNAVSLVRALDWGAAGAECLWAVGRLVGAALRGGWQAASSEAAAQAALGAFLAPAAPHAAHALRFAPPVHDLARKFFHHLLRRGRVEKAMSLAVDLSDWDLFSDARWAAERRGLRQLAEEAAALAAHHALMGAPDSECSDTCSQCSSHSYSGSDAETSASPEAVRTRPPPLPRVPVPALSPTTVPVPVTQAELMPTTSIRPNLHQYLERDNTIWNTAVRDDSSIKAYNDHMKPILNAQHVKWHSVDVLSNYKHSLLPISEGPSKPQAIADVIPRAQEERMASHFRHLFQTELREEVPNTLYRYQDASYHPSTSLNRAFRHDSEVQERPANRVGDKSKVKFSDTVTVVPESPGPACPEPARELADSLPLCAPHKYLAAFAPHPRPRPRPHPHPAPPAGTPLDYVEV